MKNRFKHTTLRAFPLANRLRLEAALRGEQGSGRYPATLLACIIAHTAHTYRPSLRTRAHDLWVKVLAAIDDEYRLPCLQVLQTTIVILLSNPHHNHGQNGIVLGRVSARSE